MRSDVSYVPYLGRRTYVQGATMFNLLSEHLGSPGITSIDFKLNRRVNNNGLRLVDIASVPDQHALACSVFYESDGQAHAKGLMETEFSDPALRVEYDESALTSAAKFDLAGRAVEASFRLGMTLADIAVALNKALLLKLEPLPADRQYVFTRLELPAWPGSFSSMTVSFWRRLGPHYISRLHIDGRPCGNLHFSTWEIR